MMGEPVFFKREPGLTLQRIAALSGAKPVVSRGDDRIIRNVAALELAGPDDITFADRPGHAAALGATQAGACFVTVELERALPARTVGLLAHDPYGAFVQVANALYPDASRPSSLFEVGEAAGSATVHPNSRVEANVTIDPGAMVGPRAMIGSGTVIGPMAVIGPDVRIGRDCSIGAGASVMNALLGDRVGVRAGCRLGGDGPLNLVQNASSAQFGRVILQDGVQLGANSTIDRGSHLDTVIGEHTVVDNLVRIPADITIGRRCIISLTPISPQAEPALLCDFQEQGVIPDHTVTDARSIALFGTR
jgi:UDP-3-O-[3-hydroxymyristoyl] glucosamine N-acyltransferase